MEPRPTTDEMLAELHAIREIAEEMQQEVQASQNQLAKLLAELRVQIERARQLRGLSPP